jgi:hypothetical protein
MTSYTIYFLIFPTFGLSLSTASLLIPSNILCQHITGLLLQDIMKLTTRISKFKILNDEIFSILNRHLQGPREQQRLAYKVALREMPPPSPPPPRSPADTVTLRSDGNNNTGGGGGGSEA